MPILLPPFTLLRLLSGGKATLEMFGHSVLGEHYKVGYDTAF